MEVGVHLASKSVDFSVCLLLSLRLSLSLSLCLSLCVFIILLSSVERAMLGYEWGSHSSPPPQLILTDDINHDPSSSSSSHHHRPIFHDPYSTPCTFPHDNDPPPPPPPAPPSTSSTAFSLYNLQTTQQQQQSLLFNDPRAFSSASYSSAPSMLSFDAFPPPAGYPVLVPKAEPDYATRIGLNLGGRTYFSTDDDLVSRLYRRSRPAEALNSPRCQAEGCNADLSTAKHYHRRHKVCEFHSKAATVITAGLTQRFCQQCSRFHQLSEFDNGKRSCRKRLADHNRRRRKSNQTNGQDHRTPTQSENAQNSPSQSIQRSPSDSGANSSSSVTVAISPPRASFDSNLRQRLYE